MVTLNGADPSEVGDYDLDDSVQASKSSTTKSPEQQSTCQPLPKALMKISPTRTALDLSPLSTARIKHVTVRDSLLDETDDKLKLIGGEPKPTIVRGGAVNETDRYSDGSGSILCNTADSIQGSDLLID